MTMAPPRHQEEVLGCRVPRVEESRRGANPVPVPTAQTPNHMSQRRAPAHPRCTRARASSRRLPRVARRGTLVAAYWSVEYDHETTSAAPYSGIESFKTVLSRPAGRPSETCQGLPTQAQPWNFAPSTWRRLGLDQRQPQQEKEARRCASFPHLGLLWIWNELRRQRDRGGRHGLPRCTAACVSSPRAWPPWICICTGCRTACAMAVDHPVSLVNSTPHEP